LQRLRDVGDEHTPMLFDAPIWSDPVGILVSPETGRMELQHSLDSLTIHFSMLTNYQAMTNGQHFSDSVDGTLQCVVH